MATHRAENQFLLQGNVAVASLIVRIIGLISNTHDPYNR